MKDSVRSKIRYGLVVAVIAAAYVGSAYPTMWLHHVSGTDIGIFWPPSGVALAALCLLGLRYWPAIPLAVLCLPVPLESPVAALLDVLGVCLEILPAAYLLRRSVGVERLVTRINGVLALLLVTVACSAVGTFFVAASFKASGGEGGIAAFWWPLWVGNALGTVVFAPPLLAGQGGLPSFVRGRGWEALALGVSFFGFSLLTFSGVMPTKLSISALSGIFAFIVWAALRFGPLGTSAVTLFFALFAAWGTVRGHGPLAAAPDEHRFVLAWAFLGVLAATALILGGAIEERRQVQRELRLRDESLVKLSSVVEQMPGLVVITDDNEVIEYVNPSFERVTGYSRGEVIGKTPGILKSGEHDSEFYREMQETIRAGLPFEAQFVNRRRDGTLYTEQKTVSSLRNEAGEITHFVSIARDVTESKRLEELLRQSQKMEAVGTLAGGVAHDFNNLLTVISGHLQLVTDRLAEGSPLRDSMEQIGKAVARAVWLTRQLLAFGRKQVLEARVLDVNAAVADIERLLRRVISEDIELVTELAPAAGRIKVDPNRLEQVILNLVVNARDAMHGGGTITIATSREHVSPEEADQDDVTSGVYVCLSVHDTGLGMDAETRGRVFEPFFTTKDVGEGTGLGLSTVFGIVRQSGGFVRVSSAPEEGSTFRVYLPQVTAPTETPRVESPAAEGPGGSETILLVEDDEAVRSLVCHMLQSQGYHVLATSSGREALDACRRHAGPIHLLLSDMVMPGMSGPELEQAIVGVRPEIRVIFMSGYAKHEAVPDRVAAGNASFIAKPFDRAELLRQVRRVLDADGELVGLGS